jgi:SAM-dependent methyltransferase
MKQHDTFTTKANVYTSRPEWPTAAFTVMLEKAGFNPLDEQAMKKLVAVDIGAGTGKTTFPLADLGCTVIAVEPNREMRDKLIGLREKGGYDNVIVTEGDALNLKIPPEYHGRVNLFYAGNAAHRWGSFMKDGIPGGEAKAAATWKEDAAPDASAAIMFLRVREADDHVRELREILVRHFDSVRGADTEFGVTKLFAADAFKDYFNVQAGSRDVTDTYGNFDFKFRDFDHFKDWLLSFSYMPDNAFTDATAADELRRFYDASVDRNNGIAVVRQSIRIYSGPLQTAP